MTAEYVFFYGWHMVIIGKSDFLKHSGSSESSPSDKKNVAPVKNLPWMLSIIQSEAIFTVFDVNEKKDDTFKRKEMLQWQLSKINRSLFQPVLLMFWG